MKRADLSLSGIYCLFIAVYITGTLGLIAGLYYRLMPMTVLLSMYSIFIVLLAAILLGQIWRMVDDTIDMMDEMLDKALLSPDSLLVYDEAKLSLLGNKLHRLLIASASSASTIAEERNRIKALVADISHQTRTPVANILLYAQLLEEQPNLSPEARNLAIHITSQSEKLGFLVQALVKTSCLETGIITVFPRPSSLAELLRQCTEGIEEKAGKKNINLQISCPSDLKALFDPKWTEEAVDNILDNAVKYTPGEGNISISAEAYELFARIDVADSGIGINNEELNLIFKRFYRSPSLNQEEGVGIGLYLAREIISLQGGYIKVKSEPQNGSVFSIFLPR